MLAFSADFGNDQMAVHVRLSVGGRRMGHR
jgi:hypothetical protein